MTLRNATAAVTALALAGVVTACGEAPRPAHHRVEMRDLSFRPAELVVARGDTVTWSNRDIVPHTVSAGDSTWDSGTLPAEGTFVWVAEAPGTVRYVCRFHPTMTGTVRVR